MRASETVSIGRASRKSTIPENGVSMDPASAGNLLAMGFDADGEMPPPDPAGGVEG